MSVKIVNVTQQYPSQSQPLYKDFNAEFSQDKVHAILGASGSGKTTLLNMVAGICAYQGTIECGNIAYAFQDDRLVDSITVANNMRLVLGGVCRDKKKVEELIDEVLAVAEISQYKDKYPSDLSGGERQRVAIARAFAYPSQTLLMDEPFNSLDYGTKARLARQFVLLNEAMPRTTLFVTHDVDEALTIADEIYVLQGVPVTLSHVVTLVGNKRNRDVLSEEYVAIKKDIIAKLVGNEDK